MLRDERQRLVKIPFKMELKLNKPIKDDMIYISYPQHVSKIFMFSSWGTIFYLMKQLNLLMDIWVQPFGLLSYTTEIGDHSILYFPQLFNYETFGFLTMEFEISGESIVKTLVDSDGIKEFKISFARWKKPIHLEGIDMESVNEKDIVLLHVEFVPISQGLSISQDLRGELPVWKVLAVEKGYEEILNRNPKNIGIGAIGDLFGAGSNRVKFSSSQLDKSTDSAFFTNKHRVLEILQDWVISNSYSKSDWFFGGKWGSCIKPIGESGYFGENAPKERCSPDGGMFGTLDDFKNKIKEDDVYLLFYYPTIRGIPVEERKGEIKMEYVYYRKETKDFEEELRKIDQQADKILLEKRPLLKCFGILPIFLFRETDVYLFSEKPDKRYRFIALRTDPSIFVFTGPGAPFYVYLGGIELQQMKRVLTISWSYWTFLWENRVFGDLELIGVFLDD